ncbi:tetratricopeptide repeat protein [Inquilinus sp.]|jgi:adenylate cyclase|uniref:tetratricopeptide repeat protein n=1 Tax=Inquilinus sp. TaxID=1932117 RepID=UPI003784801B
MPDEPQLTLRLLGGVEVTEGGQRLALPSSRKARALLVYLAATERPHRRDRLCTIFWDIPDDPRGALRSSLSLLRRIVDVPGHARILADRDTVRFDAAGADIDLLVLRRALSAGVETASTEALEQAASAFQGEFAEGLDLPSCPDFQVWCVAERQEARRLRLQVLRALIERHADDPAAALPHARALVSADVDDVSAHVALLRVLAAGGHQREAEEQRDVSVRLLGGAGSEAAERLVWAWRSLAGARAVADREPEGVAAAPVRREAEPGRRHIAVLPFTSMGRDAEQGYFADGITEDIITDLSRVSALFVVARNTAFTFRGQAVEVTEAARRLNVGYVLQGSVRRAAHRVRINVQLIDGATGDHLWSERYDRDFEDIFALQDDISRSVVTALRVTLLPEELRPAEGRPTSSVDAYEYYLQGRSGLFIGFGDKNVLAATREMFLQAIAIDPGYARAYAGVAACDVLLWLGGSSEISYEEILRNSDTALSFAPNLAEAHASRGLALFLAGRAGEATTAFERALALDPDLFEAHEWYAEMCRNTGRYAEAAVLFERAADLRETDYISLVVLRDTYASLGRVEESMTAARRGFVRIEAQLARRPDDAMALCAGAAMLASLGDAGRALAWAGRALALNPEDYVVHYNAACTYAEVGRPDAALDRLEHISSRTPRVRAWLLGIVKHDVQLNSLRDLPRFRDFLARLEADVSSEASRAECGAA